MSDSTAITACPLDCPDACSLTASVTDGRLTGLSAGPNNPITGSFICGKVAAFGRHVHGTDRVLRPLVRTGMKGTGSFRNATWDEALDLVAHRLREARDLYGGEAILPLSYGGSNGLLSEGTLDQRLFRRLGASRLARTLCAAAAGRAAQGLYGKMAGVPHQDYPAARLIVLWGVNPNATGIHMVPYLEAARRNGARIFVVDPRRIPLAKSADLHVALRPGTDLVIALAMHRHLVHSGAVAREFLAAHTSGFERLAERAEPWTIERAAAEAGVATSDLELLATAYAAGNPAVIRCGWGPERNRNGGSAIAAILALPAVAGKFGCNGGGYTLSNSGTWRFDNTAAVNEPEASTRLVNMNQAGRVLVEGSPPVKVLFAYDANPLATLPAQALVRRGLERDDLFTVVFEQVMTDTARYADVVLPATTFVEHDELSRGYGAYVLHRSRPVIAPVGEARSNLAVFGALLDRLGLNRPGEPRSPDDLVAAILSRSPDGARLAQALAARGFAEPSHGPSFAQMRDVWPVTSDRKIHLFPEDLDREAPAGLYGYQPDPGDSGHPFTLISPASSKAISSTLFQLQDKPARAIIHPHDAERLGIADGALVRLENDQGTLVISAAVAADVRPGVISVPKGLWAKHTQNGNTSNTLCPDTLTDLGGGACFNDARVALSPYEAVAH